MKTVKVKIPCVVNSKGQWNASAWSDAKDIEECLGITLDAVDPSEGEQVYWFEAELPVPEAKTVDDGADTGLKRIKDKCKQYWNAHNMDDAEFHAILESIYREADLLEVTE